MKAESRDPGPASTFASTSSFLLCNVAVGERYTLNYLVSEICRIVGKHVEPVYEKPRPGDVKHSLAAVGILRERLGLTSPQTFTDGLERLIELHTTV